MRYETFDSSGRRVDEWQVRALVPPLPEVTEKSLPERFGSLGCPAECHGELARSGGVRITRRGEPGLGAQWVVRMPVGRTFDLGSRSLVTPSPDACAP